MVAEADESDRSFLMLWPSIAVMTNIDHEHMENYGTFADLQHAFADFANKVPFYGGVVACADDGNLAAVFPRLKRKLVTYGFSTDATYVGSDVELGAFGGRCVVHKRTVHGMERLGRLELVVPGRHNLQNALAAVAAAELVGLDFHRIAEALHGFHGAERRFERHGEAGGVLIVDDYGHHPTEILATLSAAKHSSGGRRTVVVFQPHRYTRTRALSRELGESLAGVDLAVVTDVYHADEDPIPGVTGKLVVNALTAAAPGQRVAYLPHRKDVVRFLAAEVREGDLVLMMGAGDIPMITDEVLERLGDAS
jgi:UDP-N-acetylmuramate--alanine ligase